MYIHQKKESIIKEIIDNRRKTPDNRQKTKDDKKETIDYRLSSSNYSLSSIVYRLSTTVTLTDEIDISRGDLIVKDGEIEAKFNDSFEAMLVWMDEEPLKNKEYILKIYTKETNAYVSKILFKKDVNSWEKLEIKTLTLNDIARVQIDINEKIAYDFYEECKDTGAFILIDKITNNTVAAGMIVGESTKTISSKEELEFNKWNELKKKIQKTRKKFGFNEREIVYVNIGKNIGTEENGKGDEFLKPVLVFKKFNANQFIGFPLTSQKPKKENEKFYYKLKEDSYIILSQIKTYSAKRISHKIAKISSKKSDEIYERFVKLVTP